MKYVIKDWAGNVMFDGIEFAEFQDGWDYLYEHVDDEEMYDEFWVLPKIRAER